VSSPARDAPTTAKDLHFCGAGTVEGAERSGGPSVQPSLARPPTRPELPTIDAHITRIPSPDQVIQTYATIAWWLVPSASSAILLQNTIKESAPKHYGSTFHLHMALFALENINNTIEELAKATQPVTAETKTPIYLRQAGSEIGGNLDRTIYQALYPTAELETLRANLLEAVGASGNTYSRPTLASIYDGNMPDEYWRPRVRLMDTDAFLNRK